MKTVKQSFKNIAKHKTLFLVLFITQLLFLIALSFIFAKYTIAFLENANAIIEPLKESPLVQGNLAALYENPIETYEAYQQMIKNIAMLLTLSFVSYILINGVNWELSNMITGKKCRCIKYHATFALLTLIFVLPALLIINIFSRILFTVQLTSAILIIGLIVLLIALYFMYVSFSLINKYKLKKLLKQTFKIGVKKFKTLIPTYIIMLIPQLIFLVLIYFLLEAHFLLLIGSTLLLVLSVNWARIYFLTTMKEI
jgi:hypothetical protein